MTKYLICYEENDIKKWDMIKDDDRNLYLINLLENDNVDNHTIFIIPCIMVSGIWLWQDTHKSNKVDFYNFFEDYGMEYTKPEISDENKEIINEINEKHNDNTKYGWISPTGKYFHCNYGGHINLADNICFGMIDTDNSEMYLEKHGWCKIYKPLSDNTYSVYIDDNYSITDEQLQSLSDLGLDNIKDLSNFL